MDYPIEISRELKEALDAFETEPFERVVGKGREQDHSALVRLAGMEEGILPRHQQRALYGLGLLRDPGDVDVIAEVLPRLDEVALTTAIEALGRIGTESAYEAIATLDDHDSDQVRKYVVKAFAQSDSSSARAELKKIASSDRTDWLRDLATREMSNGS